MRFGAGATAPELKPVQIKVGINDGLMTEVLDGLNEGDEIVVGMTTPTPATPPPPPGAGGGSEFRVSFPVAREHMQ